MTVEARQVGLAPVLVLATRHCVVEKVAVLVIVSTSLKMVVETDIVEKVEVVKSVWVGAGTQAIAYRLSLLTPATRGRLMYCYKL
jgi:hypothetical protein